MGKLYNVAIHKGRWGFWCDAIDEKELIRQLEAGNEEVGAFTHPEMGLRKVVSVGGNRKDIVKRLPKKRTFFALSCLHDGMDNTWTIQWVGHIGCFPHLECKEIMLKKHREGVIIAVSKKPSDNNHTWVSVVETLPEMLIPTTSCCDL